MRQTITGRRGDGLQLSTFVYRSFFQNCFIKKIQLLFPPPYRWPGPGSAKQAEGPLQAKGPSLAKHLRGGGAKIPLMYLMPNKRGNEKSNRPRGYLKRGAMFRQIGGGQRLGGAKDMGEGEGAKTMIQLLGKLGGDVRRKCSGEARRQAAVDGLGGGPSRGRRGGPWGGKPPDF